MLFGLFKRVPKASPKRLAELEQHVTDVELALAWCKKAIVDLNARMATIARKEKAGLVTGEVGPETEQSAGDAPEDPAQRRIPFPHSRRGW